MHLFGLGIRNHDHQAPPQTCGPSGALTPPPSMLLAPAFDTDQSMRFRLCSFAGAFLLAHTNSPGEAYG